MLRAIPDDAYRLCQSREGRGVAESSVAVVDHEDQAAPASATIRALALDAPGEAERDREARARALARLDRRLAQMAQKLGQRGYECARVGAGRRDRLAHILGGLAAMAACA